MRQRRWQAAADLLDGGLTRCRDLPYPYAEAKTLWVYGQLHLARGEPEQAHSRFTAAFAILNRLGERLYAERIARARANMAPDM